MGKKANSIPLTYISNRGTLSLSLSTCLIQIGNNNVSAFYLSHLGIRVMRFLLFPRPLRPIFLPRLSLASLPVSVFMCVDVSFALFNVTYNASSVFIWVSFPSRDVASHPFVCSISCAMSSVCSRVLWRPLAPLFSALISKLFTSPVFPSW